MVHTPEKECVPDEYFIEVGPAKRKSWDRSITYICHRSHGWVEGHLGCFAYYGWFHGNEEKGVSGIIAIIIYITFRKHHWC